MAYMVSQLRRVPLEGNDNYYMSPLTPTATTSIQISPFSNNSSDTFKDFALKVSGGFKQGKVYYIRFKVLKVPHYFYSGVPNRVELYDNNGEGADRLAISLILKNEGEDEDLNPVQVIGNCTVPSFSTIITENEISFNQEYITFSFVFSPIKNCDILIFRLNRMAYDVLETTPRNWLLNSTTPIEATNRVISSTLSSTFNMRVESPRLLFDGMNDNSDICQLNNIVPDNVKKFIKFGFQSRPGTLIVVNGEPIKVGRSGIYEIDNGTKIDRFMIAAPNGSDPKNIDAFLLDYAYITT